MSDIDWENGTIRTLGKGRKEAYAPLGQITRQSLSEWFKDAPATNGNTIWGINKWGITNMLRRFEADTSVKYNPYNFRRTFASLLWKAGVYSLTIKDPGRW